MYDLSFISTTLRLFKLRISLNLSISLILNILHISRSTLYEWVKLYANDPTFSLPLYHINIRRRLNKTVVTKKVNDSFINYLKNYILTNKIISMKHLRSHMISLFNISISKGHMYRLLKDNNLTYKHMQKYKLPIKINYEERKTSLKLKITKAKKNIISIDETSIELGCRPNYGWSTKGKPCKYLVTEKRQRFTLLMAINKTKIIGYQLFKNACNGENFKDFISDKVKPKMKKANLLMDNARIHHYTKFKEYTKNNDMNIIYNIPYCPEYNPIEYVFNILKKDLSHGKIDTYHDLENFMKHFHKKTNKTKFRTFFNKSFDNLFL
jgi:transposase